MKFLVIEVMLDREVRVYTDADVELTIIDWKNVKEDADESVYHHDEIIEQTYKELLHKTTGLKKVY